MSAGAPDANVWFRTLGMRTKVLICDDSSFADDGAEGLSLTSWIQ